jgi:HEAT repeat protein
MRMSWRGPRLLTLLLALAGGASASTTAARLSVSPAAEPAALARTLQSKNATEAAASAYWLGLKGPAAVPEIPRLIAALGDDRPVDPVGYRSDVKVGARSTPGEEAAEALARLGQPAIAPLITTLRASASAVARRNAAWALGQINSNSHGSTTAASPRPNSAQHD